MTRPEKTDDRPTDECDDQSREGTSERSAEQRTDWSAWVATLRDVSPYLDLGWRLMGAAALPVVIGYGVDTGVGTEPWGVLTGGALGMAAAVVQLMHLSDKFADRTQ